MPVPAVAASVAASNSLVFEVSISIVPTETAPVLSRLNDATTDLVALAGAVESTDSQFSPEKEAEVEIEVS